MLYISNLPKWNFEIFKSHKIKVEEKEEMFAGSLKVWVLFLSGKFAKVVLSDSFLSSKTSDNVSF